GEPTPFVMELPPYRIPTLKGLLIHTWERTWQYIKKAGTIILGISILLWAMMTYPGLSSEKLLSFESERNSIIAASPAAIVNELSTNPDSLSAEAVDLQAKLQMVDRAESEQALRSSFAGTAGRSLEAVSRFAGFDWRTNIALVGGFAAKEVIVSTLGTAYSIGEVALEKSDSLGKRLRRSQHWNKVIAVAALVFIMFYAPCFVTVACIAKESSWGWAAFSMAFNTVFAFILAVLVYQVGFFFNLG
ncbi:MAG: ferrous iron transport protein B, partial [Deltaproteobacteria bacterium]|nr:ferrous iron transport protein B [Deltaproteobacteria bacterium]